MAGIHDFKSTNATNLNFGPHFSPITQAQINQDPSRYSTPIVSVNTQIGDHEEILSLAAVKVVIDWSTGKPLLLDHTERYYKPPVKTGKLNNSQGPGHEYGQRTYNQNKLNAKTLDDLRRKSGMPGSVTEYDSGEEQGLRAWAGQNVTWASHNFNVFTSRHLLKYNTKGQSSVDTYVAAVNKYGLPRANPINPVNQNKELYNLYQKATGRSMKSAGLSKYDAMSHAVADVAVLMDLANTKGEAASAIRHILQNQNMHNVTLNKFGFGSQVVQGNFHIWDPKVDPGFLGPTRVGSVTNRNYLPRGQYNMTGWPTIGGNGPMPTPTPGMFPPNWGDLMTSNTDAMMMLATSNEPLGRTSVLNMAKPLIDASKPSWRNFNAIDFFKQMMPGLSNRGAKRFTEQGIKLKEANEAAALAAANVALDTGVYQGKYNEAIAQSMGFVNGIDDIKALKQGIDRTNTIWELGERTKMHNNLSMLATQGKIDSGSVNRLERMMPGSLEQNQAIWREERDRSFRNEVKEARRHNRIRHDDYVQLMDMDGGAKGRKAFEDAVKSVTEFNKQVRNAAKSTNAFISSFHSHFFDPRQLIATSEQGAQGAIQRLDFLPKGITKPMSRYSDMMHRAADIGMAPIGQILDTWKGVGGNIQALGGVLGGGLGFAIGGPAGAGFGSAAGQLPGLGINIFSQVAGNRMTKEINTFWKDLQIRFDMLGMVVDIVSVPFKLLAKATQSLIGMFKGLGVSLTRFVSTMMSQMSKLGTPITGLTGVDTTEYQRLNALDSFFGMGGGTLNSMIESMRSGRELMMSQGRIDETKMVSAFLSGGFSGWYNGDFKGMVNRYLNMDEISPMEYANMGDVNSNLPFIVQRLRNMGVKNFDDMLPGNYTNHGRMPNVWTLNNEEYSNALNGGYEYSLSKQGIGNGQMLLASKIWDSFGADLMGGLNDALNKAVRGDWNGAWSSLTGALSNTADTIRSFWERFKTEALHLKADATLRDVWNKIKKEILKWGEDDTFIGKIRQMFESIVPAIKPAILQIGDMWIDMVFNFIAAMKPVILDFLNMLNNIDVNFGNLLYNWQNPNAPKKSVISIAGDRNFQMIGDDRSISMRNNILTKGKNYFLLGPEGEIGYIDPGLFGDSFGQSKIAQALQDGLYVDSKNNKYFSVDNNKESARIRDYAPEWGMYAKDEYHRLREKMQDADLQYARKKGLYRTFGYTDDKGNLRMVNLVKGGNTWYPIASEDMSLEEAEKIASQGGYGWESFAHQYVQEKDPNKMLQFANEEFDNNLDAMKAGTLKIFHGGVDAIESGIGTGANIAGKYLKSTKSLADADFFLGSSGANDIADEYTEKETKAGGTMGTPIYVTASFDFGSTKVVITGDASRDHVYRPDSSATEDILVGFANRITTQGEV